MKVRTLLALLALLPVPALAKRKDDVVVMRNGDRLTGEIKGVVDVVLKFKPHYMASTAELDWHEVERIESRDYYIVVMADGSRYLGLIDKEAATDKVIIRHGAEDVRAPAGSIVRIEPQETTILKQLQGSVNAGFSFFNGNHLTQFTFSGSVAYEGRKNQYSASLDSVFGRQDGAADTVRYNSLMGYKRMLTKNWFAGADLGFLHSSQQELDLRTSFDTGIGRYVIRKNGMRLSALGGVVFTDERYTAAPADSGSPAPIVRRNVEALLGVDFKLLRFSTTSLDTNTAVFGSITDPGRVRMSANTDLSWEFYRHVTWTLSVYNNFDSRPPANLPRQDFGITNTLGWRF